MPYHLAQLNIAKMIYSVEDPRMAEFMDNLDPINQLAEEAPGFVWRLQTEEGDATAIRAFEDPKILLNMSMWEDVESFRNYVYKSQHLDFFKDREKWFEPMTEAHMVMWWVAEGHLPDVEEAKKRLEMLRANGPTPRAFTVAKNFEPEVE
ncbi:MAG: DUF3291 domain-containing protein [Chloroflexi bacterium]|nr:MAG: DUF3291 domain-containing protein [Chloroflexota bacterium]MBL1193355.1 DUF3291 domain-containing protein [Chloroflexota bacterium]NOH10647.1 DUF3291 domain-containing protein [Chloroflexota bacterium]